MNNNSQSIKRLILINTCFLILPSVVIQHYLHVESNTLFAVLGSICLLLALHENRWQIERRLVLTVLLLCLIGLLGTIFSGTASQFLMGITLSLNIVIVSCGWRLIADRGSLRYLTILGLILIAGAFIAVIYALAGGPPLAEFELIGLDRNSYFYLATFTNSVQDNLIRPAGIFDEPGGFAMFLTAVVALNEAFRVNIKWSMAILCLGLITGSFALLVVMIVYLLYKIQQRKEKIYLTAVLVAMVGIFFLSDKISTVAEEFFLKRMEIVDGRIVGDNRSNQVESFFELVDLDITLKGAKALNIDFSDLDQSSNPFSIYFNYGAFMWIPYVILELWLLYCAFSYSRHLRFPAMAMFLTLLQRPYIYSLYWAMMIVLVCISIHSLQTIDAKKIASTL